MLGASEGIHSWLWRLIVGAAWVGSCGLSAALAVTPQFAAGKDDFIAKPVVPQTLFDALLKWLAHPRACRKTTAPTGAGAAEPENYRGGA